MSAPSAIRPVVDLSDLPSVAFGSRDVLWWGVIGFMIVEGMTLACAAAAWFFLQRDAAAWPPPGTPLPGLVIPTINLAILLASLVPYGILDRAAKRLDAPATTRWLWISTAFGAATVVLRWFELRAVHVSWDGSGYGSAVWAVLVGHYTLLIVDLLETGTSAVIFAAGDYEPKHFPDASDNVFYTRFMVLVWVPLYAMVYLLPRWI
ncbi:MAG TPA: cytochrome c oxidase subunit 3 [Gemmatimonadales bacterium]|nr:cytochrome c oxidase subunit 3 [Gemmatimonadales bacterium]